MSVPQYFAQIDDNNIVTDVHVVTKVFMETHPERYTGTWIETYIEDGKTYAGIGYTWNGTDFVAPVIEPS